MKRNYLDSPESYDRLVLDYFRTTYDRTGLYTRVFSALFPYSRDTSFNQFMKLVLSYKTPRHFIMDQRTIGKKAADVFVKEFPRFLKIYNKNQRVVFPYNIAKLFTMIKINFFNSLVFFILVYGAFQYGRVHDEGIKVSQPELNHIVYTDRCDVVTDTSGNVYCIWYEDQPYVIDPVLFENL